ncbi:MAG: serine/threonine protein kinase [Sandaracinaceae bacterium]|nr:serine/threonine protein kinase [Sandaracinaceae bacterium]
MGTKLGGYLIEKRLGAGATGVVYQATPTDGGRPLAIKVLNDNLGHISALKRRFEREARALAKLKHPHVVHITDFGVDHDITFIAMELLIGETLEDVLQRAPIDPLRAVGVALQTMRGVAFAHQNGIVHRDLKPANIFLRQVAGGIDVVKVLDFGLAKFLEVDELSQDATLTRKGRIVGTPAYMAPEQITGVSLDVRAPTSTRRAWCSTRCSPTSAPSPTSAARSCCAPTCSSPCRASSAFAPGSTCTRISRSSSCARSRKTRRAASPMAATCCAPSKHCPPSPRRSTSSAATRCAHARGRPRRWSSARPSAWRSPRAWTTPAPCPWRPCKWRSTPRPPAPGARPPSRTRSAACRATASARAAAACRRAPRPAIPAPASCASARRSAPKRLPVGSGRWPWHRSPSLLPSTGGPRCAAGPFPNRDQPHAPLARHLRR